MSTTTTYLFSSLLTFTLLLPLLPALPAVVPDPDSTLPIQTFHSTPPATIPAFPEQSDAAICPLSLPNELFHNVKSACGNSRSTKSVHLHKSRCCPVLAAWLYSAYSATALGRPVVGALSTNTTPYELPLLPDDSETCVDSLQKELNRKGIELMKPNATCDVVYCYCGIRLHPLSCSEAFTVTPAGELSGRKSVKKLEKDCLGNAGLGGCSKCLNSLHLLSHEKPGNNSKSEQRTSKMHKKDCQLMGLTWLLAKNRSAYIHTVSSVLRAMMMSKDGKDPRSCSLNSDGMPLAVDSSEINGSSSPSDILRSSLYLCLLSILLIYLGVHASSFRLLLVDC